MRWEIIEGDCLKALDKFPSGSIHCCVTSPPYWGLRDYGVKGQFGLEKTPEEYVEKLVAIFRKVRRVFRDDGTLWLNLGDSYANTGKSGGGDQIKRWEDYGGRTDDCAGTFAYAPPGLKPKDLVGIPWRVAFALQADGWYLRSDIIWSKPNPMPESVTDRPTKAHEYIFLLAKSKQYYYDSAAVSERSTYPGDHGFLRGPIDGCDSAFVSWRAKSQQERKLAGIDSRTAGDDTRNRRSVWVVPTNPYPDAHFATFPPKLIEPCILAGCPVGGMALDPFAGAGTTGLVSLRLNRSFIGIELNPEYCEMARKRIEADMPLFNVLHAEAVSS